MVKLIDSTGQTVAVTGTMEQAAAQAETMPQIRDLQDTLTGDTWSRSGTGAPWIWHWENW